MFARALRVRQRPDAPRQILCSGHYDTVYGAEHRFQHCRQLDAATLNGPGVADMKGGIVVMLAALLEFERTAHSAQVGWEVLLTPDEETGSVASRPVIEAAAAQAGLRGSKLVVMHAMNLPREGDAAMGLLGALPALETPEVRGQKRALAAEILNSALTRLQAKGEILVTEEEPAHETLRLAESLPAGLVVVGTHGRGRLARLVLGSMAARIVETAPCSVLVTRERSPG